MGIIKKLKDVELVGGTGCNDVYPVTSIKAVYDTDNIPLDESFSNYKKEVNQNVSNIDKFTKESIVDINDTLASNLSSQDKKIEDFEQAIKEQVENYKPIINNGSVTNSPDEEDITSNEHNLLQFKDRNNLNGMGYKILRRNRVNGKVTLNRGMINQPNTIYEIRYDFDLANETITIPENCILKFEGGSLSNGSIIGDNTKIVSGKSKIFFNINISGGFVGKAYVEWWGAKGYDKLNTSVSYGKEIEEACNSIFNEIVFDALIYYTSETINCNRSKKLIFNGTYSPGISSDREDNIIKYNSGGTLATDKDINLLVIKLYSQYKESEFMLVQVFSIFGGNFDVSNCPLYSKDVITIECSSNVNTYPDFHNISIIGPSKKLTLIEDYCTGTGIKITRDKELGHGSVYGGYINAYISMLYKGFYNACPLDSDNLSVVSNINFNCCIDDCPIAYDFGANTYGSSVYGSIQSGRHYKEQNNDGCLIIGNLLNISFFMKAWDTNSYSSYWKMATTRYVFNITDSVSNAPLLFGSNADLDETHFKGNIWAVKNILNRTDRRYNDIYSKEFANYVHNDFIAAKNIEYKLTECTTNSKVLINNVFLDGVTVYGESQKPNMECIVSFTPPGKVKRFAVVIPGCYGEDSSTFKNIKVNCYNENEIILTKSFINMKNEHSYYTYFGNTAYEIEVNDELQYAITRIEVILSNPTTTFKHTTFSIQGGGTNNFCHINNPWRTEIYDDGDFILDKYKISIKNNVLAAASYGKEVNIPLGLYLENYYVSDIIKKAKSLYIRQGALVYISTSKGYYPLVYQFGEETLFDTQGHEIKNNQFVKYCGPYSDKPFDAWEGFPYFDSSNNRMIFYNGTKWIDSDGNPADAIKEGITSKRPANVKDGFYYFDTTINKPIWKRASSKSGWVNANGEDV